jgi:hypothetical protein
MSPIATHLLMVVTTTMWVTSVQCTDRTTLSRILYVGATAESCDRHSGNCKTLQEYMKNMTVFSTSHTEWIFLQGTHTIAHNDSIVISNTMAISWRGDSSSQAEAEDSTGAVIVFSSSHRPITIHNSSHISISDITLYTQHTTKYTGKEIGLNIQHSSDVVLTRVRFSGVGVGITCPVGHFNISQATFNFSHISASLDCEHSKGNNVSIIVEHTQFVNHAKVSFNAGREQSHAYNNIQIILEQVQFAQPLSNTTAEVHFALGRYAVNSSTVQVSGLTVTNASVYMGLQVPLWSCVNRTNTYAVNIPGRPTFHFQNVNVTKSKFKMETQVGMRNEEACPPNQATYPGIVISDSHFMNNNLYKHLTAIGKSEHIFYTAIKWPTRPPSLLASGGTMHTNTHPLLQIKNTKFLENDIETGSVVHLENFNSIRAVFSGNNALNGNNGTGVYLNNSVLQIQDYSELVGNNNSAITMTSHSRLHLTIHSLLNITQNTSPVAGGGIFITFKDHNISTFKEFADCYINKITCPGWCFFQLLDESGNHPTHHDDFKQFNSTLSVFGNTALPVHTANEIFNGHFYNCGLHTRSGLESASRDIIATIFGEDLLQDNSIGFLPYRICKCEGVSCHCDRSDTHNTTCSSTAFTAYPTEPIHVRITVLGDFGTMHAHNLRYSTDGRNGNVSVDGCTEIFTTVLNPPNSHQEIRMQSTAVQPQLKDYILQHNISVNVTTCPPGMELDMSGCKCNRILTEHGFECTMNKHRLQYTTNDGQYWIGQHGSQMYISKGCLNIFCNRRLMRGITYEELVKNQQCQHGRLGLLCSECPQGKSTVLGFSNCLKCPDYSPVIVLCLAITYTTILIAFLLPFNFTVQQGTYLGIIFFINTMKMTESFYKRYSWSPLTYILGTLSIAPGYPICVFNGMEMFGRATFGFVPPIVLMVVTTLIIVAAQKCNLRILKVKFVAQRAVPLLATFMYLTYTRLMISITYGLAYVEVIDVETEEKRVKWMYGPQYAYFRSKHIVLGCLSIVFIVFYLLPFTFILLFGDLLRRYTRNLWFTHFLDTFHGAFRYPCGFWLGVRLLLRAMLVQVQWSIEFSLYSLTIAFSVVLLWFLQTQLKPFKKTEYKEAEKTSQCIGKCSLHRLWYRILAIQPETFDSVFLMNTIVIALCGMVYNSRTIPQVFFYIAVNAAIVIALVEMAIIASIHAYRFFPVPNPLKRWFKRKFRQNGEGATSDNSPDEIEDRVIPTTELAVHMNREDCTVLNNFNREERVIGEDEQTSPDDIPYRVHLTSMSSSSTHFSALTERLIHHN